MAKSNSTCCIVFALLLIAGFIVMAVFGGIHHRENWGVALLVVGPVMVIIIVAITGFYLCFKDFEVMH